MTNAIVRYFQEALEELHHVRWPTRQQAVRLSAVVLAFTLVCSLAFGLLDFLIAQLINLMLSFVA